MCLFYMGMCLLYVGMCLFYVGMCLFYVGMCLFYVGMCLFYVGMFVFNKLHVCKLTTTRLLLDTFLVMQNIYPQDLLRHK
jgi:hypothetical protein